MKTKQMRIGVLGFAAAMSTGVLSSCAAGGVEFEQALVAQAEALDGGMSLPGAGTPFETWDEMVILCPYASTQDLEPKFAQMITDDHDLMDESSQWFIFAHEDRAEALRLSRTNVDFCAGQLSAESLPGNQAFAVAENSGQWVLTPVN